MMYDSIASPPLFDTHALHLLSPSALPVPDQHTDLDNHQDNTHGIRGETALWRAVITQALMDASSNSSKEEAKNDRMQALRWLCGNNRDFKTVCYYAGYDPSYLRKKITAALARNCRWRAIPHQHFVRSPRGRV